MIAREKNQISFIQMAKWLACAFIIVENAIIPMGFANGNMAILILGLLVVSMFMHDKGKPRLITFVMIETVFVFVTVFLGAVIAEDKAQIWVTSKVLVTGLVFGYCTIRISMENKSVLWFVRAWIADAVLLFVYFYVTGGYAEGRLSRLSVREGLNPNTLGVFMMIVIWCSLYMITDHVKKDKRKLLPLFFHSVVILISLYIILGTASRKALLASIFVIVFWALFALLPLFKHIPLGNRMIIFFVMGIALILLFYRFSSKFVEISATISFRMERMMGDNMGDTHRFRLIKNAFDTFLQYPVFGVGWNNFKHYSFSGQHSHNAFLEVLVCTGVVGAVPALIVWFLLIKYSVKFIKSAPFKVDGVNEFALLAVFLFINLGQIMYYNMALLMILHLIVTICLVGKMNKEETTVIQDLQQGSGEQNGN